MIGVSRNFHSLFHYLYPVGLLTMLLLVACTKRAGTERLPGNEQALSLLTAAVDKAGGRDRWQAVDTLSLTKKTVLYTADGQVEKETEQHQTFVFRPRMQVRIFTISDSLKQTLVYNGDSTIVLKNGLEVSRKKGASSSVLSAAFVLSIPYELFKDADVMSYEGRTHLSGKTLQTIKVDYGLLEEANDTWWFYFENDHSFWGSRVWHRPNYALIQNVEMDTSTGLTFPAYRRSYRVDSLNNAQFLRAEFWYSNYQMSQ